MQADLHGPAKKAVYPYAAGKTVVNPIREARRISHLLKLVPMGPLGKRSNDLLILKEAVVLHRGVKRNPTERADFEFDARARLDATVLPNHPDRGKCGTEDLQCILTLMESENCIQRCVDFDTSSEGGHCLSFPFDSSELYDAACRRK